MFEPLDSRYRSAAAHARLGQEGFEVLADHLVQDGVLGTAADVGRTCAPVPRSRQSWTPSSRRPLYRLPFCRT
jgi:hypothetical protein